jgi:ABC-type tungstate transport system substrate-binding protein
MALALGIVLLSIALTVNAAVMMTRNSAAHATHA